MGIASIKVSPARIQNAKSALAQAEARARSILARQSRLKGFGSVTGTAGKVYTGARGAISGGATGASVAGAASAIGIGASAGSIVPIVGTAIGAIVGILASGVLSSRPDPENANFDQAIQIYKAQGAQGVYNIADKYLVLAGLFDLHPGQIHGNNIWYKKYGRMGEHKFVTDLMTVVYRAEQAGKITASDTPQSIYNRIVVPWFNSWGMGTFSDPNSGMLQALIVGMIAEYVAGMQSAWRDVNGNYTFNLPSFVLPVPSSAPATAPAVSATSGSVAPVSAIPAPAAVSPTAYQYAQLPTNVPQYGLPAQYLTASQAAGIPGGAPAGSVAAITAGSTNPVPVWVWIAGAALLGVWGLSQTGFAKRSKFLKKFTHG